MPITPEVAAQFDLTSFLEKEKAVPLKSREARFRADLAVLKTLHALDASARILEIGTGAGWFQVMCLRNGIDCEGIELSPQLVDNARELGRQYGVEVKIRLGNIEDTDIGAGRYDAVIAQSVLEHLPNWKHAVEKIHFALKPAGVFYFCSTNKFAFVSGEYPAIPLYGWLPDRARYWIRTKLQGPTVMLWPIDFNQFRYPLLKRFLRQVGFRDVLDYVEMKDADALNHPTCMRRLVTKTVKSSKLAKYFFLTFWPTTVFLCRK